MNKETRRKLFTKAGLDPEIVDQEKMFERNQANARRKELRDEISARVRSK